MRLKPSAVMLGTTGSAQPAEQLDSRSVFWLRADLHGFMFVSSVMSASTPQCMAWKIPSRRRNVPIGFALNHAGRKATGNLNYASKSYGFSTEVAAFLGNNGSDGGSVLMGVVACVLAITLLVFFVEFRPGEGGKRSFRRKCGRDETHGDCGCGKANQPRDSAAVAGGRRGPPKRSLLRRSDMALYRSTLPDSRSGEGARRV